MLVVTWLMVLVQPAHSGRPVLPFKPVVISLESDTDHLDESGRGKQFRVTCEPRVPFLIEISLIQSHHPNALSVPRLPNRTLAIAEPQTDVNGEDCECAEDEDPVPAGTCGEARSLVTERGVNVSGGLCTTNNFTYTVPTATCRDIGVYACRVTHVERLPRPGQQVRRRIQEASADLRLHAPLRVKMSVTPDPPVLGMTLTLTCTAMYGVVFEKEKQGWKWEYLEETGEVDSTSYDKATHSETTDPSQFISSVCAMKQVSRLTITQLGNVTGKRVRCIFEPNLDTDGKFRCQTLGSPCVAEFNFTAVLRKGSRNTDSERLITGVVLAVGVGALAAVAVVVTGVLCQQGKLPVSKVFRKGRNVQLSPDGTEKPGPTDPGAGD